MSFLMQSRLVKDVTLLERVAACAALEGAEMPWNWASDRAWVLSAQPGWVDAYASAVASGDTDPGANEGAVTDQMILSAVQSLLGEE